MNARPRKRPRPSRFLNGIDFWAFLGVEIVLLMIFMVAPSYPHHGMALDLARADHAKPMLSAVREDAMIITVMRDGNVFFFGTHQIQPGDLPPAIRDAVRRGSERKVYLKVDARAKYRDAAFVIDQIRLIGIQKVGIITDQRQRNPN